MLGYQCFIYYQKKKMDYYGFDKDPKKIDLLKKTNPIFQMSQVNN